MKYILEFEDHVGTHNLYLALKDLGLVQPIIVITDGLRIEDRGAGDICLKRPGIVEKLQREINELDQALHYHAGHGNWTAPYPDVED